MNANEVIQRLDGADLFLRNRANAAPAPLNEYDTCLMQDAAEACNEAGQLIQALICESGKKVIRLKNGAEVVVNLDMCKSPHGKITRIFNEFKTRIGHLVEGNK